MTNFAILICLILFLASTGVKPPVENPNLKTTGELLRVLSSDSLEGRAPGTEGMAKAVKFVEDYYKTLGIAPFFKNSYRDTFSVNGKESYNMVGIINADSPSDDYILIGAHLDHLGKVNSLSDSVYNGANDNASGVTAVLQIAEELTKHKFEKKVLIALFSGEEAGLVGSEHLSKKLKRLAIPLSYMINFEMIGKSLTKARDAVYITGFEKSNLAELSNEILKAEFIVSEEADKRYGLFKLSDNYPFYKKYDIPAHTISTFDFHNFQYYHDRDDEFSELDTLHMEKIIDQSAKLIAELLKKNVNVELRK